MYDRLEYQFQVKRAPGKNVFSKEFSVKLMKDIHKNL